LLALISGVAAPIASALAERLRQRDPKPEAEPASTPPEALPQVIVIVEGAQAEVTEPEISPDELLRRLLASDPQLTEKVSPATKPVVQVKVIGRRKR
jgi:hypothetical protein